MEQALILQLSFAFEIPQHENRF